jgi:type VI secretion system protein VasG
MVKDEISQVLKLADALEKRVIGQRHALETIARRVQNNRARLDNPNRPVGVFMLVGPSGTGKTETALALAEATLRRRAKHHFDQHERIPGGHTVSTLKGSPPGYVGYGEGGILTEAVRRRPSSVVLLDEVEKAHHDVHEIFFQVFDKGWMEDAEGRFIDFKNTIIILTSNAAQDVIINLCKDRTAPRRGVAREGDARSSRRCFRMRCSTGSWWCRTSQSRRRCSRSLSGST